MTKTVVKNNFCFKGECTCCTITFKNVTLLAPKTGQVSETQTKLLWFKERYCNMSMKRPLCPQFLLIKPQLAKKDTPIALSV
jgi:hypothetical protein